MDNEDWRFVQLTSIMTRSRRLCQSPLATGLFLRVYAIFARILFFSLIINDLRDNHPVSSPAPPAPLSFTSLNLPAALMRGIEDAGFTHCTPIQAQTLPQALLGRDIAGQAQTGTGKTAAFLIAMMARLLQKPAASDRPLTAPRGFILAPTRELAMQIHKDAELLCQHTGLRLGLAFGGVDYEKQRQRLASGVDILIGTPGRIIDFYKQHVFDLRYVDALVLDEADRMFDLGFISDIRYLMRRLPPPAERLSMLFSATLSQRILELAFEHMNDPIKISIAPEQVTADRVKQVIYFPAGNEKNSLLLGLIPRHANAKTMVFCNMKRTVEQLEAILNANGIPAKAMSGDVPQNKRLRLLNDFHSGQLSVLIATDVAARGLHIPDVTHVFNYDLPQDPEDYVHRIGRTARAGASGDAISFGCEDYVQVLPDIERYIGNKIPVENIKPENLLPVIDARPVARPSTSRGSPRGRPPHARSGSHSGQRHGDRRPGGGQSSPSGQPSQSGPRPPRYPDQKSHSSSTRRSGKKPYPPRSQPRYPSHPQPVKPDALSRKDKLVWTSVGVALVASAISLLVFAFR